MRIKHNSSCNLTFHTGESVKKDPLDSVSNSTWCSNYDWGPHTYLAGEATAPLPGWQVPHGKRQTQVRLSMTSVNTIGWLWDNLAQFTPSLQAAYETTKLPQGLKRSDVCVSRRTCLTKSLDASGYYTARAVWGLVFRTGIAALVPTLLHLLDV